MLCDADVAAGDTLEPFIALSLCTVTRRIEPAGRSFQQTYEQREAPKHPRKSDSSEFSCISAKKEENNLFRNPYALIPLNVKRVPLLAENTNTPEEEDEDAAKWKAKSKNKTAGGESIELRDHCREQQHLQQLSSNSRSSISHRFSSLVCCNSLEPSLCSCCMRLLLLLLLQVAVALR